MKASHFFILMLIAILVSGCTSAPRPRAHDFTSPEISIVPNSDPNKSLIYFYRKQTKIKKVCYYIYDEKKLIGALKPGAYFYHWTSPGEHIFWSETEEKASVQVETKQGEIYYIEGGSGIGMVVGVPTLTLVPDNIGKEAIKELKYSILKEIPKDLK